MALGPTWINGWAGLGFWPSWARNNRQVALDLVVLSSSLGQLFQINVSTMLGFPRDDGATHHGGLLGSGKLLGDAKRLEHKTLEIQGVW